MKKLLVTYSIRLLSLVICLSVFLMGVHAKELTGAHKSTAHKNEVVSRKVAESDSGLLKIQHDPHNHVDHQTSKSIVKVFNDQSQMNTDARSLRKVRHPSRSRAPRQKLKFSFAALLPIGA